MTYTRKHSAYKMALYYHHATRSGQVVTGMIGEYSGYLQADGYSAYNSAVNAVRVGCWVHAKHKFIDSLPKDKALYQTSAATKAVEYINRLFALEREYERKNSDGKSVGATLSSDEKMKQRNTKSKTVAEEFFEWIITVDSDSDTQLNKAIGYIINKKKYLMRFLEKPNIDISNSRAENSV